MLVWRRVVPFFVHESDSDSQERVRLYPPFGGMVLYMGSSILVQHLIRLEASDSGSLAEEFS